MDNNTITIILFAFCCVIAPIIISIIGIAIIIIKKPLFLKGKITPFIIGIILWSISYALMAQGYGAGSGGIQAIGTTIGLILAIVLWIMSCIGWDSFPVGGGGGFQLKLISTVIIAGTIIGFVCIAYWTGKCILQWYVKNAR